MGLALEIMYVTSLGKCELHLTNLAETRTPTRLLTEDCTMGARLFEKRQSGAT
jgi:hypothetical protein